MWNIILDKIEIKQFPSVLRLNKKINEMANKIKDKFKFMKFEKFDDQKILIEKISENCFKVKKIGENDWLSNISTNDIIPIHSRVTAKITILNFVSHADLMGGIQVSSFFSADKELFNDPNGSRISSQGNFLFFIIMIFFFFFTK